MGGTDTSRSNKIFNFIINLFKGLALSYLFSFATAFIKSITGSIDVAEEVINNPTNTTAVSIYKSAIDEPLSDRSIFTAAYSLFIGFTFITIFLGKYLQTRINKKPPKKPTVDQLLEEPLTLSGDNETEEEATDTESQPTPTFTRKALTWSTAIIKNGLQIIFMGADGILYGSVFYRNLPPYLSLPIIAAGTLPLLVQDASLFWDLEKFTNTPRRSKIITTIKTLSAAYRTFAAKISLWNVDLGDNNIVEIARLMLVLNPLSALIKYTNYISSVSSLRDLSRLEKVSSAMLALFTTSSYAAEDTALYTAGITKRFGLDIPTKELLIYLYLPTFLLETVTYFPKTKAVTDASIIRPMGQFLTSKCTFFRCCDSSSQQQGHEYTLLTNSQEGEQEESITTNAETFSLSTV